MFWHKKEEKQYQPKPRYTAEAFAKAGYPDLWVFTVLPQYKGQSRFINQVKGRLAGRKGLTVNELSAVAQALRDEAGRAGDIISSAGLLAELVPVEKQPA